MLTYEEAFKKLDEMYRRYQGRSIINDDGAKTFIPWLRGKMMHTTPGEGENFTKNMILMSSEYREKSKERIHNIYKELLNRGATEWEMDLHIKVMMFYEPMETAEKIISDAITHSDEYKKAFPSADDE